MKTFLSKIDRHISTACHFSMVAIALALTALMIVAVFLRYVMGQSFPATEEVSILLGVWLYFTAMIVVTRERSHLTGGIIELFDLSVRTRSLVKAFNDFIGLCVICIFTFYTVKYLMFVMKINRSSTNLQWPMAMWVSSAVLGFFLMAVYKVRDLFMHENRYTVYDNKSPHSADAKLEDAS